MNLAWLKIWHYSWGGNQPESKAEREVAEEREYMQAQLRQRDNPFGLTPEPGDEWPEPVMEGQMMTWVERSHFCGRQLGVFDFIAVRVLAHRQVYLTWVCLRINKACMEATNEKTTGPCAGPRVADAG